MDKVRSHNNHNSQSYYCCRLCHMSFPSVGQLMLHRKKDHPFRVLKRVIVKKRNRTMFNIGQFKLLDPVDRKHQSVSSIMLSASSCKPQTDTQKEVDCTDSGKKSPEGTLNNNNSGQNSTLTKEKLFVDAVVEENDNNKKSRIIDPVGDQIKMDEPQSSSPTNKIDVDKPGEILDTLSSRRKQQIQSRTFEDVEDDDHQTLEGTKENKKKIDCSLAAALTMKAGRLKVMMAKSNGLQKMKMRVAKLKQNIFHTSKPNDKSQASESLLQNPQKPGATQENMMKTKRFMYGHTGDLNHVIDNIKSTSRPVRMGRVDPMKIFEDSPPSSPPRHGHQNIDHGNKSKVMPDEVVLGKNVHGPPQNPTFLEKKLKPPASASFPSTDKMEIDESKITPKKGRPGKSRKVIKPANNTAVQSLAFVGHVVGVQDYQDDPPSCSRSGRIQVKSKKYDGYFCDTPNGRNRLTRF